MNKLVLLAFAIICVGTAGQAFADYFRNHKGVKILSQSVALIGFFYLCIQMWNDVHRFFERRDPIGDDVQNETTPAAPSASANPLQPKKGQVCTSLSKSDKATINTTEWRVGSGNEIKKRVRVEVKQPTYTSIIHILVDSQIGYIWTKPGKPGTKYSVERRVIDSVPAGEMDEKCQDWTADYALFEVPENINFTDD